MAASFLKNLPSHKADSFSKIDKQQLSKPLIQQPESYCPTHDTSAPVNQVIETEATNILLRQFIKSKESQSEKKSGSVALKKRSKEAMMATDSAESGNKGESNVGSLVESTEGTKPSSKRKKKCEESCSNS
mmetsp:Transcript_28066/g.36777  ORF Transcript_28066/g.36777 Transcript_28066/m.36777 type:complete len:131 (-) Transcript_28066:184-576(-)|eukprot:CAMPEP_0117760072 /NCGR_PEP_ID=MMETSP0947-20121206/16381_1 /TAXON_ID=44440 /ORGANISM="Chattonella subsalsa, Strain CCMP2191" /LENGTH=130 /DNA_ID=CAMNT_0005580631 /DNA_START=78 /DNA_END=470 /DNA_ORIENTATION=-